MCVLVEQPVLCWNSYQEVQRLFGWEGRSPAKHLPANNAVLYVLIERALLCVLVEQPVLCVLVEQPVLCVLFEQPVLYVLVQQAVLLWVLVALNRLVEPRDEKPGHYSVRQIAYFVDQHSE